MDAPGTSERARVDAKTAPLTAIVTPVYNGANYLRELMDSVQAQTYPNLVHVVLDNCSKDATAKIISQYLNARVPVITARNESVLPLSANWNAALALVPPDAIYVRVICHDDLMAPDAIQRMVEVAERHPDVGVVISDVKKFNEDGSATIAPTLWPDDIEHVDGRTATRAYFRNERVIIANQVLFRKSAMAAVRGREFYSEDLSGSDYDAVLAVLSKSNLGVVHAPLALERIHGLSEGANSQTTWRLTDVEWLLAMVRHGPAVYTPAEWRELFGRYKRRYLRRMFKWRFSRHGRDVVRRHLTIMKERGVKLSLWDHASALIDGVPVKLGLKEGWGSFPW